MQKFITMVQVQTFDEYFKQVKEEVKKLIPKKYVNDKLEQTFRNKRWHVEGWYIHDTYNVKRAAQEFVTLFVA